MIGYKARLVPLMVGLGLSRYSSVEDRCLWLAAIDRSTLEKSHSGNGSLTHKVAESVGIIPLFEALLKGFCTAALVRALAEIIQYPTEVPSVAGLPIIVRIRRVDKVWM